ncbi:MAG: YlmC/YmxH family sporulation protein [Oscillospiraceae bacterium]|jgi:YlmC/YmxH family sporulation protein|nr:YlmC/YmxH family sporulation protein [Oscillospiraceae bacterium]
MECRIEDFRYKEVVNINDGQRLGCVCDALIDVGRSRVIALIVPGRCRFLGLFWREEDYIIPWECIRRIGGDIVLIDVQGEYLRGRRERRPWFTWQFDEKHRP